MAVKKTFTSGELAKLCGISKQTLIFYDRQGIFKPKNVNLQNGYRYYTADQLETLDSILILKEIGFSLRQIREIIAERELESVIELLKKQRISIEERIHRDIITAERLDRKIKTIERLQKSEKNSDVELIDIAEDEYLAARRVASPGDLWQVDVAFKKLFKAARENDWGHFYQLGVMVNMQKLKSGIYTQADFAVMPLRKGFENENTCGHSSAICTVKPSGRYICCLHKGDYDSIGITYKKMMSYADENGIKCGEYAYEYCVMDNLTSSDNSEYMTVIHIQAL